MKKGLTLTEVKDSIEKAERSFRHKECATCECFLGYVTQLKMDSGLEAKQFLKEYLPNRDQIHSCLGCDPCAPGILYSNYLRKRSSG